MKKGILKLNPIQKIFLQGQEDILSIIADKNKLGMATYKERKLLEEIQAVIEDIYKKNQKVAPSFIEKVFRNSKLDRAMRIAKLTSEEGLLIERISDNFMSNILQSGYNLFNYLKNLVVQTKKEVNKVELNISRQDELFKQLYRGEIQKRGLVAFTDRGGKNWNLGSYSDMLLRTTTRMAHNYGILYTYEHIDLYQISKHGSTCKICAPLEGRVYSRSGTHPIYPPLASAFGKINKNGKNDLSNTYLNIHPNCLIPGGKLLAESLGSLSRRYYQGKVIQITDERGNQNTITINHPILTNRGFIAANKLKIGDKIVNANSRYSHFFRQAPNNIDIPTAIDKIVISFKTSFIGGRAFMKVPITSKQFHGDVIGQGEVDIIFTNSFIERIRDAIINQYPFKIPFPPTFLKGFLFNPYSTFNRFFFRALFASHRLVRSINFIKCRYLKSVGFKNFSNKIGRYIKFFTNSLRSSINIIPFNNFIKKFFIVIYKIFTPISMLINPTAYRLIYFLIHNCFYTSKIIDIQIKDYEGYVYNPETEYHFYSYNNIISSNCQHTLIPFIEEGKSKEEVNQIRAFSNFESNPPDRDPRSEAQMNSYRKKEDDRIKLNNAFKEFQTLRLKNPSMPKTFNTFIKHKMANDIIYQNWKK